MYLSLRFKTIRCSSPHHTLYSVWYVCVHVHACVLCVQVYMHIFIGMCRGQMSTSVVSLDFLLT